MRHVEGRKERKADEEIKGGHSANELVKSPREWEWCGECSLEELCKREQAIEKREKNCKIIISI